MAKKDTTQTGVEKPVKQKVEPTFYNPRNDFIDQIALQAEKDLESPGEETSDPDLKLHEDDKDPAQDASQENKEQDHKPDVEGEEKVEPVPDPGEEQSQDAKPEEEQDKDKAEETEHDLVTIKVDGEERQVPRSQVLEAGVRALQKESAADERLKEATRLLNEVKQSIPTPKPSQEDAKEPPPEEDVAALARAIQVGSAEEAEDAIFKLKKMTTVDHGVIARMIDDRIEIRTAAEWFKSEYPDIFSVPKLVKLAGDEDERLLEAGDKRSYRERYRAIGDDIRTMMKSITDGEVTKVRKQMEADATKQKHERKAATPTLPTANVKHEQAKAEDEQEESPSDVIANIAKQRGQTIFMR